MTFKEAEHEGLLMNNKFKDFFEFRLFKQVAVIKEGYSFGELALIEEKGKRKASIQCIEDSEFVIFTRKNYDEILKKC